MDLQKTKQQVGYVELGHFGAHMSHEQPRTHKIHHGPDLGEATTFPFIIYFLLGHGTNT
jgi:hypothetical protein